MSGLDGSSSSIKPNRWPLTAMLAVACLILPAAWYFVIPPQQALAAPEQAATTMPVSPPQTAPEQPTPIHGRVLAMDGSPVRGATVFVALPGPSGLRIRNGKINFENSGTGGFTHVVTGADGQYDLPPQTGNFVVEAISDAGYAQIDQDAAPENSDIRLTAWGQIKGRLLIGTKPGAGMRLQAGSINQMRTRQPVRVSMANFAETDADGNFTMNCVAPGLVQIYRGIVQQSGGSTWEFSANIGMAQVTAGQTATVTLGGVGRPVVGKFIFAPGMNSSDYFINARAIGRPSDPATPNIFLLEVDGQHHFRMSNVVPGDYKISVLMQKVKGGDRTRQPEQAEFSMPEVPGGVSDEPLVIPDIRLQ